MESNGSSNSSNLTTQQIHQAGVISALNAAVANNDEIIKSSSGKYYIDTPNGLREVILCCSTSTKNRDRINCNISRREYQNRFVNEGYFNDKVYILVHMNLETMINRYFKITHSELCMLQYGVDCIRFNKVLTMQYWLGGGKGRNNIPCDALAASGFEVWK